MQTHTNRARILDPVDRASEICFGLFMALSFTGSISVATSGQEDVRIILWAALACNIAWGVVDAVMYIIGVFSERTRNANLLLALRGMSDPEAVNRAIADALPSGLVAVIGPEGVESLRSRLSQQPAPPLAPRLTAQDAAGAVYIFLLVTLATFPVVLPFIMFADTLTAMRVSNGMALVMLFAAGYELGRYAGMTPWRAGAAMAGIGMVLVAIVILLGG